MRLAKEITTLYCGILEAEDAEQHFKTVFQKNLIPEDIDELILSPDCFTQKSEIDLIKVIVKSGIANSNNEARRLIAQNDVKIDGEKFNNSIMKNPINSFVVQVGKAKFIKVTQM